MNKDFLNKPISLKDIKISNINIKNLKNKKEIGICILVIIYIIGIICVGAWLIDEQNKVKSEFETKESRYLSLQRAPTADKLKEQIAEIESEKALLSASISEISTTNEFYDIFNEFKKGSSLKWDISNEDVNLKPDSKDFPNHDIYVVTVKSFTGTLDQIEAFLEYVDNYEKIVRVDTISMRENKITGNLSGQLRLSFYFKKLSE